MLNVCRSFIYFLLCIFMYPYKEISADAQANITSTAKKVVKNISSSPNPVVTKNNRQTPSTIHSEKPETIKDEIINTEIIDELKNTLALLTEYADKTRAIDNVVKKGITEKEINVKGPSDNNEKILYQGQPPWIGSQQVIVNPQNFDTNNKFLSQSQPLIGNPQLKVNSFYVQPNDDFALTPVQPLIGNQKIPIPIYINDFQTNRGVSNFNPYASTIQKNIQGVPAHTFHAYLQTNENVRNALPLLNEPNIVLNPANEQTFNHKYIMPNRYQPPGVMVLNKRLPPKPLMKFKVQTHFDPDDLQNRYQASDIIPMMNKRLDHKVIKKSLDDFVLERKKTHITPPPYSKRYNGNPYEGMVIKIGDKDRFDSSNSEGIVFKVSSGSESDNTRGSRTIPSSSLSSSSNNEKGFNNYVYTYGQAVPPIQYENEFKMLVDKQSNKQEIKVNLQRLIDSDKFEQIQTKTVNKPELTDHKDDQTDKGEIPPQIYEALQRQTDLMEKLISTLADEHNNLRASKNDEDFEKILKEVDAKNAQFVEKEDPTLNDRLTKMTKKPTPMPTVMTLIDETEIRKALKNDPLVKRILQIAARRKQEYLKRATLPPELVK